MKNLIKVTLCTVFAISISMAAPAFSKGKPIDSGNGASDAGGKVKCAISIHAGKDECKET